MKSYDAGPLPTEVGKPCITVSGRTHTASDVRRMVQFIANVVRRTGSSCDACCDLADEARQILTKRAQSTPQ